MTEPSIAARRKKRLNLEHLDADVRAGRPRFRGLPDVVSLLTTEVCNLRCVMCPRSVKPGVRRLPRGVLVDALDSLFPTARKAIVSPHHGEPLVSDFDLVLDRARQFGVKLDVVTNGVLLTGALYREARDALDCVNVSVDSIVPEVYERIRAGGRFEHLRGNLEQIAVERRRRRDGVTLTLSAVVMRSTLPHLADFLRFAAAHSADAVVLQPLRHYHKPTPDEEPTGAAIAAVPARDAGCPRPHALADADALQLRDHLRSLGALASDLRLNLYFNDFQIPAVEPRRIRRKVENAVDTGGTCWFVARNFGLMFTGDVYPCCHPTNHVLGNVRTHSIEAIWNGERAQALRRAHFSRRGTAFCNGCIFAPYLPARRDGTAAALMRQGRLAWTHVANAVRRRAFA